VDERVAELERELEVSLSDYDGELATARDAAVAATRVAYADIVDDAAKQQAGGEGPDAGDGGGLSGADAAGGGVVAAAGEGGEASRSGRRGGSSGQGGVGAGGSNTRVIPEDLPDPQGDDVVARQIREAAMKESDPELRERLWDEYRRYRDSIGN
jgi:hypothetical protein